MIGRDIQRMSSARRKLTFHAVELCSPRTTDAIANYPYFCRITDSRGLLYEENMPRSRQAPTAENGQWLANVSI